MCPSPPLPSFAAGLFEGAELDGKELREKPEKVAYLEKLLKYTEDVLGEAIPVRWPRCSFPVAVLTCILFRIICCR